MIAPRVEFHPAAISEARFAKQWYAARNDSVAKAFVIELDHAIEQIAEAPNRWPKHGHGTRRYLLHRFPYLVIYRQVENKIQVLAIAHGRRRPGYWKMRAQETQ